VRIDPTVWAWRDALIESHRQAVRLGRPDAPMTWPTSDALYVDYCEWCEYGGLKHVPKRHLQTAWPRIGGTTGRGPAVPVKGRSKKTHRPTTYALDVKALSAPKLQLVSTSDASVAV
jgi:hypothetical protein